MSEGDHRPIYERLNALTSDVVRLETHRTSDLERMQDRKEANEDTFNRLERRISRLEIATISTASALIYGGAKLLLSNLGVDL